MIKSLLPDGLWQELDPLLPPPKPRRFRFPGRKQLDRRKVLTGILFVLKTGISWDDLPAELGLGCGRTCRDYLKKLQEIGALGTTPYSSLEPAPPSHKLTAAKAYRL